MIKSDQFPVETEIAKRPELLIQDEEEAETWYFAKVKWCINNEPETS